MLWVGDSPTLMSIILLKDMARHRQQGWSQIGGVRHPIERERERIRGKVKKVGNIVVGPMAL